jgi:hypothetical protein
MANGFDRRGALIGVILLLAFMLVGAAVLALPTLEVRVVVPPAANPASR